MNQTLYCDRHGNQHHISSGHRNGVWLDSRTGYSSSISDQSSSESILEHLGEVLQRVRLGTVMMGVFGRGVAGGRVLTLGASNGAEVVCLSGMGAAEVVGTDYGSHFVSSDCDDQVGCQCTCTLANQRARILDVFRENAADLELSGHSKEGAIRFLEDDIAGSDLTSKSFDTIVSWATLEHLLDPASAFREMHRLLVPGGMSYHEYNPFFCMDGGHSLCTLDFPWGHVRLDADDFAAYLREFRPLELRQSLDFYQTGLNRMSIAEVEQHARAAGFDVLALVPRSRTEDLLQLSRPAFEQCRRNYPDIMVNDLVCRIVRIVLRRPE